METKRKTPKNIDEYIAACPAEVRPLLEKMRSTIRVAAPQAVEAISYQIPTFKLKGNLVHFAAFKDHLSFFPTSSGVEHFKDELAAYKNAKGTVQFPLDRPIPYDLVERITRFRVQESLEQAEQKKKKK